MLKSTRFIFLLVLSTLFLFPFFWMLVSSFKPNEEVLAIPVKIFPKIWQIDAYTNLMNYSDYNFPRYFFNSIFVTIAAVLLAVILCTTAGYGFAGPSGVDGNIPSRTAGGPPAPSQHDEA